VFDAFHCQLEIFGVATVIPHKSTTDPLDILVLLDLML
jgi:hypothetical protein